MTVAEVRIWGRTIGAAAVDGPGQFATFEFTPEFVRSGIQLAPLAMPLANRVWQFAELPRGTFHGLPGLLADSLPDRFGNAVIDAWLAAQGRLPSDIDAVERLCYTGTRGMGALEFRPAQGPQSRTAQPLRIAALFELASEVLRNREALQASFADAEKEHALREILRVGASAGGARAKAVVAWNPTTNEVRSGQVQAPAGFEYWLLKFDGVGGGNASDLGDSSGYGAIEFAYSQMAQAAGLRMSECRLFEESGRRHFMTQRFDRLPGGGKVHMQSLGGLAHFDFNAPGAHSYEQALVVIRRLGLPMDDVEELFRRMVFNVVARNQDDHVKNIAFLMNQQGQWSLAPAFDVNFSHNPVGGWTQHHQMSLAGKRDGFTLADLRTVAQTAAMKRGRAETILAEVIAAVQQWREFATAAGVADERIRGIANLHRLTW